MLLVTHRDPGRKVKCSSSSDPADTPPGAAGYYDDPAVAAGPDAEILYIRMISWCAMHLGTDGKWIPLEVARSRLGFTDAPHAFEALEATSLVTVDDTTVTITSWIRNRPSAIMPQTTPAKPPPASARSGPACTPGRAAKTNPETAAPAPEKKPCSPPSTPTNQPQTRSRPPADRDAGT